MIKAEEDLLVSFRIVQMISSFTAKIRFKNCKDVKENSRVSKRVKEDS